MSAARSAQTSKVGFFDRSILSGTYHSGGGNKGNKGNDLHYNFKAFKIGDDVEIHYYINRFSFHKMPIIKMTCKQFEDNFIPILNTKELLKIGGVEIAPGNWNADQDDIRKVRDVVRRENPPSSQEMKTLSNGGKSRRRCKRSKKRSRKTMHRRSRR
jgi:hypothetical protein